MPEPAVADSVRLAWPNEASDIAAVQRRGWAELSAPLATALLASVDEATMVTAWRQVIARPTDARSRVLAAVSSSGRLVGFATTAPCPDPDTDEIRDGAVDELWVDPAARHRGHGSRLLNACADTLVADGFSRALCWVRRDDVTVRRFLALAGWEPDGAVREIGDEQGTLKLEQIRLHAGLEP